MATSGKLETNYAHGVSDKWYLSCSWSIKDSSISGNYTTIDWTVSLIGSSGWVMCNDINLNIGGTTYNIIGGRQKVYKGTLKSGTHTIYHNNKGEGSMWMKISGAIYNSSINASASNTYYLPDIPRGANITSVYNITDEQNATIYYNNPLGNSVTSLRACMTYWNENTNVVAMYRDIPKTGNRYDFILSDKERELLRSQCDSRTKTIYYYIETVTNGQKFTNYKSAQITIVNAKPTITYSAYDSNSKTTALTGDNKKIIKGYSDITISMSSKAYKSATIKRNSIFYNNSWHEGKTNATWNGANDVYLQCWTMDSRGWETYEYPTLTLIDYYKPQCTITLDKPSAEGKIDFTIHGNYWKGNFGQANNTLDVQYIVREEGTSAVTDTWEKVVVTPTGNKFDTVVNVTGLDYRKTYSIQAWIGDSLSGAYSARLSFTCRPLFDWSKEDFNFNVPIHVSGENNINQTLNNFGIANRIVEEYDNYPWHIIKYENGQMEQYGWFSHTINPSDWSVWASHYYVDLDYFGDFAETFTGTPYVFYSTTGTFGSNMSTLRRATNTNAGAIELTRPIGVSEYCTVHASVLARGRWK